MKILHTSDWHVGKPLRGASRASDHRAVLAEMATLADAEAVDLILVVGDLFDSAAPTAEAEEIVYRALLDLGSTGAVVAVVAGNHDNQRRLAAVAPVLDRCDVIVASTPVPAGQGGVREFTARSGEPVRLALLPFVNKRQVVRAEALMSSDAAANAGEYSQRIASVVASLTGGFDPSAINIVASHVLVTGGTADDGGDVLQTIFDYWVSPTVFPPSCHYVALGDLHRRQQIAGACPIWYSGSPLQLGPGEIDSPKGVLLVEASAGKPAIVKQADLTSGRRLRRLRGTLAELEAQAGSAGDEYLYITVNGRAEAGLAERVRHMFPGAVEVSIPQREQAPSKQRHTISSPANPHELFAEYLGEKGELDEAVLAMFDQIYEEVHAPDPA